jgi:MraZ protein
VYGRSTHQLDPKGRVFVPKRLQEHLPVDEEGARTGLLTRGMDGCLALMSPAEFEREVARLETSLFAGPEGRRFHRMFFSQTFAVTLDKSGRLQLPKELRTLAGLDQEAMVEVVGLSGRIELWAASRWKSSVDDFQGQFDGLAPTARDPFAAPPPSNGAGEGR